MIIVWLAGSYMGAATLVSNNSYLLDGYNTIELDALFYANTFSSGGLNVRLKIMPSGGDWIEVVTSYFQDGGNYERHTISGNIANYEGMYKIMIEIDSGTQWGHMFGPLTIKLK